MREVGVSFFELLFYREEVSIGFIGCGESAYRFRSSWVDGNALLVTEAKFRDKNLHVSGLVLRGFDSRCLTGQALLRFG